MFPQEANKAAEIKLENQEAPQIKAEKLDASEEVQHDQSQGKRRGKERRKAVKSTETLQSKPADERGANKNAKETSKTRSGAAAAGKPTGPVKASRGPQKKVGGETNSRETEEAARERRRPPERAQAPNSGLRRSKRIASRR